MAEERDEFYYLEEEYDGKWESLRKNDLIQIINRHGADSDEQVNARWTKAQLVDKFEADVWKKRKALLRAHRNVKPSSSGIEKVTETRRSRKLDDVHLSPGGPRTRSRSRSPTRTPKVSPNRRKTRKDALKATLERVEEAEPAAEPTGSPRKRRTAKKQSDPEVKNEAEEPEVKEDPQTAPKSSTPKAKAPPKSPRKKKVSRPESAETSFSSENPFQEPSSADFKRKREGDESNEHRPARRREIAPHKHKQTAPQSLPKNAAEVFKHTPDLQIPADISHEPFDISYGESNDFVDQVLNLPDASEFGAEVANEVGAVSTPEHTKHPQPKVGEGWLPSFNKIQDKVGDLQEKVGTVLDVANDFAKTMDGDITRSPSHEPSAVYEELPPRASKLAAAKAIGGAEEPKDRWYAKASSKVYSTVAGVDYKWYALGASKVVLYTTVATLTASSLGFAGWLGLWIRTEKIQQGYCDILPVPVHFPAILEQPVPADFPAWVSELQDNTYRLFESFAPTCTPCPDDAKCTLYEAHCRETYVKDWPFASYLGLPLAPRCVPDPVKQYKLNELKKRAVNFLNSQRAAYECDGARTPSVAEGDLRQELYARKAQGVSDELFEELYEKIRSDFSAGDIEYPEISVSRQVPPSSHDGTELTLTPPTYNKETLWFVSSSLSHLSLVCRFKLHFYDWVKEHQEQLQIIFCASVVSAVLALIVWYSIRERRRLENTYNTWITVLKKLRQEANDDVTGQKQGFCKSYALLGQIKSKKERDTLQKRIEANPSVRVRTVETAEGEVARTWEWVPS